MKLQKETQHTERTADDSETERERESVITSKITTNSSSNNNKFCRTLKHKHCVFVVCFIYRTLSVCERGLVTTVDYNVVYNNHYFLFMFYRSIDEHVTNTDIVYRLTTIFFILYRVKEKYTKNIVKFYFEC